MSLSMGSYKAYDLAFQRRLLAKNLSEGAKVSVEIKKNNGKMSSLLPESIIGTVKEVSKTHLSLDWKTDGNVTGFSRHTKADWDYHYKFKPVRNWTLKTLCDKVRKFVATFL